MRKWRVDRLIDGEWHMYGMYSANFIQQLAAAIQDLVQAGYKVYETIRVVEVGEDG